MDYGNIFQISAQSNAQIILSCLTGYVAARRGIITTEAHKGFSRVILNLLLPFFLFAEIGKSMDLETLLKLWPITTFYFIFAIIASILAIIGGYVFRWSIPKTKFAMTGIIFNNVTSMSIALLVSIGKTDAIMLLTHDKTEPPAEIVSRGISYLLIANLMGNLGRWSLGTWLLRKPDNSDDEEIIIIEHTPHDTPPDSSCGISIVSAYDSNSHKPARRETTESTSLLDHQHNPARRNRSPGLLSKVWKLISDISNPPLLAALLALIVCVNPTLKYLIFSKHSFIYNSITTTVSTLGHMTIPLTLLTLGAQLYNLSGGKNGGMLSVYAYIMSSRFLVMPVLGISLVLLTRGLYFDDPMLLFVLMLMASGPSAVNCINICQLTNTFEEEMAELLMYSYGAVAPIMTMTVMGLLLIIINIYSETGL
ncbi:836_t:CDS:2 [Paraglomus occultum]|uniref:836_t:CDS:1 n=1 Tax=Paraglomus occultum TaxID=144539 RepID=A0A9N9BHH1_9GLOM|nr:836_t:CDS:2 [Paraglomus occultum]